MADLKLVPASKLPKRTVDCLGEKCIVTPVTKDIRSRVIVLEEQFEKLTETAENADAEEQLVAAMCEQLDILLDPPMGGQVKETHAANDLTLDQVAEFLGAVKAPDTFPN